MKKLPEHVMKKHCKMWTNFFAFVDYNSLPSTKACPLLERACFISANSFFIASSSRFTFAKSSFTRAYLHFRLETFCFNRPNPRSATDTVSDCIHFCPDSSIWNPNQIVILKRNNVSLVKMKPCLLHWTYKFLVYNCSVNFSIPY